MSLPVWGNLAKSQTDAGKIEEAIVRLITEHNEDETAHLGVGQSLQSHKAAEIIDHLAESIVEDKIADGEVSSRCITEDQIIGKDFRTAEDVGEEVDGVKLDSSGLQGWESGIKKVDIPVSGNPIFRGNIFAQGFYLIRNFLYICWETISNWNKTGSLTVTSYLNYLRLTTSSSYQVFFVNPYSNNILDFDSGNPEFQICLKITNSYYNDIYIGPGHVLPYGYSKGFGFQFYSNHILGYVCNASGDHTFVDFGVISSDDYHVYSAKLISGVKVEWYIDNILVGSLDYDVDDFPSGTTTILFSFDFNELYSTPVYESKWLSINSDL